jgi:putative cardiolipin synthase
MACVAVLASGCAALPPLEGRSVSHALAGTEGTRLGAAVAPLAAAHPGKTGIHPILSGPDAFAARVLLARAAQRSIDVQYYIWRGDQTGLFLLETLAQAARRGVRVRILLDDQNSAGIEDVIAAFGAEPNLEVRLYNPFARRDARFLDYLLDFGRMNRRMHNKAFVADNQAAVVGGRNIGNEYFGAGSEVPFKDLDVLAIGPAVREVSDQFDLYWNSGSAYPASALVGRASPEAAAAVTARIAAARADPAAGVFAQAVRETALVRDLVERRLEIEWAEARLVRDDPAKTLGTGGNETLMLAQLLDGQARARRSVDIISPYFVPAERGAAFLEGLVRSGVRVRVLTNSLAATDVTIVHSGYSKRRCRLARAGVVLFEMKPAVGDAGKAQDARDRGPSSGARLHAKSFAADGERVFVGSFNFDPRSALLNTEMGLVIASPALARRMSATFDHIIPRDSYEVRARTEGACVEWLERTASGDVVHPDEPHAGWAVSAWLAFLALLPIDWML